MISSLELPKREETSPPWSYRQHGVEIVPSSEGFMLSYIVNGVRVVESLPKNGPEDGIGEVNEDTLELHAWYDWPNRRWVVMHSYLVPGDDDDDEEWDTDTIFLYGTGKGEIKTEHQVGSSGPVGRQLSNFALLASIIGAVLVAIAVAKYVLEAV
jgi:hypothetical protein